eukprot:TRINITY_DN22435_c0_g1_i1.p1 TRINITY_DN22435_c0_g1~~TRINITY_DN22435_c0_g1_i1.p1  ORF type:complete len:231 (+),score=64.05 TRINITY_DN22435_c0_g1_i1:64-756(+)
METPGWQKALIVAGGAAAVLGLAWYLTRDGEDDDETSKEAGEAGESIKAYFKVTDKQQNAIGCRVGPDLDSARTGELVTFGTVFAVTEIVEAPLPPQRFLKLAGHSGWVFTHSGRDGRLLAEESSAKEFEAYKIMEAEEDANMTDQQRFMMEAQQMLMQNPGLREQIMNGDMMRQMMADPAAMQQLQAAAQQSQLLGSGGLSAHQQAAFDAMSNNPEAFMDNFPGGAAGR